MIDVLEQSESNIYEKAKKYANIVQRYLALQKQGDAEKKCFNPVYAPMP